jgi:hypothetical protein
MAQEAECLPSKHQALTTPPVEGKIKEERRKKKKGETGGGGGGGGEETAKMVEFSGQGGAHL